MGKVFSYDVTKYPFREAIADILDVDEQDLHHLHKTTEGRIALEEELTGSQHRKRGKQPHFIRLWTRSGQTDQRDAFNQILDNFVAEFVSANMSANEIDKRVPVAY